METNNITTGWLATIRRALFKESRSIKGIHLTISNVLGAAIAIFYFYTTGVGIISVQSHLAVFFSGTLALIFLWFPASWRSPKEKFTLLDGLLALLALGSGVYFIAIYETWATRPGVFHGYEVAIGWISILLALEAARRSMGVLLPFISVLALLYCLPVISQNLPPSIMHRGMDFSRIAGFLYGTADGLFGVVTYSLATYVLPFVILGAFLEKCGAGKFFIELPYALLGHTASGAGMVSVVSSAMMGSIVGSPTANVVATGTFTIPLMKKTGYKAEDAAAIETAVSSGSMFTPPVMGAAAFFMVEFTGIPYIQVITIAAIPAILFFLGVGVMVHLNAKKTGLRGTDKSLLPRVKDVLKESWYYPLPLVILIAMLAKGFSPGLSAFYTCMVCVAISWFRKESRMGMKEIGEAFLASVRGIMAIAGVAGAVGIIVGVLSLTGLALKFSSVIVAVSGGSLILTIVMVAFAALILGTGTPITAVYIILAIVAPKALMDLGVSMAAAHMMLIWFSQLSGITPPVCIVAYSAAAIAKADPFKTGFKALRYGMFLIIIPLLFAYTPLLLEGETIWENIITTGTSAIAVIAVAVLLQNYLRRKLHIAEQALLLAGSIMLFGTNYYLNGIGTALVAGVFATQFLSLKHR